MGMGREGRVAAAAIVIALSGVGRVASVEVVPGLADSFALREAAVAVDAPATVSADATAPGSALADDLESEGTTAQAAPRRPGLAGSIRTTGRFAGPDLGAVPAEPPVSGAYDDYVAFTDRRLTTTDNPHLPVPTSTDFVGTVQRVPVEVVHRSTWHIGCPVGLEDLRYVTVTHVGFDGLAHTGELMVHHTVAEEFVEIFRTLYEARYPIERMWVVATTTEPWLDPWWHGSDNNSASFVCRNSVASGEEPVWSQHAYGLAVDINPFHNPYVKGDLVIPPHATSYLHRDDRPGIIHDHDVVVTAFEEIGWYWGGNWSSSTDWMHFSWNDH